MASSRIRWSFVVLGTLAIGTVLLLATTRLAHSPDEPTELAIPYFLAGSCLFCIILMVALGWKVALSRDSSQHQMDFMFRMTHELQTPVANIRLASGMLTTPAVISSPERCEKYVRILNEESHHMQWHIENVLYLAKARNCTLRLEPEKLCIEDLIANVLERYREKIGAEFSAHDAHIAVDRQHFTNVLHNLIDNALKYTPETPHIVVSTRCLHDQKIVVSVKDNGIGIAQDQQKKIFDSFYRVQDSAANAKGFGLGLSYVQQIVKAHQWKMELTSRQGEGTDFRIIIPQMLA